jgi:hypothetical protein
MLSLHEAQMELFKIFKNGLSGTKFVPYKTHMNIIKIINIYLKYFLIYNVCLK